MRAPTQRGPPLTPNAAEGWTPALQLNTVLLSIQSLLGEPNPNDPLADEVAAMWKSDIATATRNGKAKCSALHAF